MMGEAVARQVQIPEPPVREMTLHSVMALGHNGWELLRAQYSRVEFNEADDVVRLIP